MTKFVYIALICTLAACCFTGCGRQQKPVSRSELLLDTVVTITLYGGSEELLDGCFDLCREYERVFSRTRPDSELYALNQAGTMAVSDHLLAVLSTALDYCTLSGGAFDITMGGVSDLYGFSSQAPRVPEAAALSEAVSHVGYENVRIEGSTVTLLDREAVLDLGAIAKGYIADRLADYLAEQGQTSAIIDLGGNVLCLGSKPDGSLFKVGVQSPFKDRNETIAVLGIDSRSVVTSGVYERSFTQDGVFYHHILDPDDGLPVRNELAGVSIVSRRSVDGDALSTVCFALGLEDGLALINALDGVEALFITADGQLHHSTGFEPYLVQ